MTRPRLLTLITLVALAGSLVAPGLAAQSDTRTDYRNRARTRIHSRGLRGGTVCPGAAADGLCDPLHPSAQAEIFPHSHPGTVVLGVASGTLGWTLLEGTHVVRGAAAGATSPAEDLTEPGTEVVLEPGDAIFYEDDVVHTARGAGDEETVVWEHWCWRVVSRW